MPGDRVTLATVPDRATADLLCEVLRDGGVETADVQTAAGNAYLGRAQALDYQVRVDDVDEARARQVLADFEDESGQAATAQAEAAGAHGVTAQPDGEGRPARRRWVFWVAAAIALVWLVPLAFSGLVIATNFVRQLFQP